MNYSLVIPLILGTIGILQGTINRQVATHIGVAQATLITNLATVIICFIFYFYARANAELLPEIFQVKAPFSTYK